MIAGRPDTHLPGPPPLEMRRTPHDIRRVVHKRRPKMRRPHSLNHRRRPKLLRPHSLNHRWRPKTLRPHSLNHRRRPKNVHRPLVTRTRAVKPVHPCLLSRRRLAQTPCRHRLDRTRQPVPRHHRPLMVTPRTTASANPGVYRGCTGGVPRVYQGVPGPGSRGSPGVPRGVPGCTRVSPSGSATARPALALGPDATACAPDNDVSIRALGAHPAIDRGARRDRARPMPRGPWLLWPWHGVCFAERTTSQSLPDDP